jgi:hypothetical protein
MKLFLVSKWGVRTAAIAAVLLFSLTILPTVFATSYDSVTVSPTNYSVATWFYFDETGYIIDNGNNCIPAGSPCFSVQLNVDTAVDSLPNFYQALLSVEPDGLIWSDYIGCSGMSCSYSNTPSSGFSSSAINSTNNIFVMSIDSGSSSASWTITSCNYGFTTPAYSFKFLLLSLSACTASNIWTDTPGSSYFAGNKFTYMQNVPVGFYDESAATFHHTQMVGEYFDTSTGTYTGSSSDLTGETSNMVFKVGTLGTVVPMCYYSTDVSAPC